MSVSIILYFIGVALYSYIVSNLINVFANVTSFGQEKSKHVMINKLLQKANFSDQLVKKIHYFFKMDANEEDLIFITKSFDMDDLLLNLPAHLKAEIAYYLYKEAI